jgi:membrane-associated phospholipid phosphatase
VGPDQHLIAWKTDMQGKLFPDVLAHFLAHWRLKLSLTAGLGAFFWSLYSFLGRNAFFPLRTPPTTWLDRVVPYQPEPWGWVYLSQFLITGGLPWFLATRQTLRRYAVGFVTLSAVSFLIFFFFPVASPRPETPAMSVAMTWILGYDGQFNAFPSLHAGFLVYMIALAKRMAGGALPFVLTACGLIWGALILYATIATRQHYVVDLIAGGVVGVVADWFAWRDDYFGASAATTIARKNGVTSHDGCR